MYVFFVYYDILTSLPKGHEVDVIFLDLEKAFDNVSYGKLVEKLNIFGIEMQLSHWFKCYLTGRQERVILDGEYSDWLKVTSGVPQGSILGPCYFLFTSMICQIT